MKPIDRSPALSTELVKQIDRILERILCYTRGTENMCLVPLNTTARRSNLTEQDKKNVNQFLDYMEIYPNAAVRFHSSDMILCANTDASYMTELQAQSYSAAYLFLGSVPSKYARERLNGPLHVNCKILNFVAAYAAEAETGGCFVTGRDVIILRNTLEEMDNPKPITKVCMENTTATGISNNKTKQHQPYAINMRYFGIRDKEP